MLGDAKVYPVIAVANMDIAKEFYINRLGMQLERENETGTIVKSDDSKLLLYMSEFAGTNEATAALWEVSNVDAVVDDLTGKGISFEVYEDMEDVRIEGVVHVMDEARAAWFKDPDGNVLCVSDAM